MYKFRNRIGIDRQFYFVISACEDIFCKGIAVITKRKIPLQKIFLKQVERIFCPEFALLSCQHSDKKQKISLRTS